MFAPRHCLSTVLKKLATLFSRPFYLFWHACLTPVVFFGEPFRHSVIKPAWLVAPDESRLLGVGSSLLYELERRQYICYVV